VTDPRTSNSIADLGRRLAELVGTELGLSVEIVDLSRLTGGASRETWSVDAHVDGVPTAWILQRERPGGVRTGGGMSVEASLLAEATRVGVPVPTVVMSGDQLGSPFVLCERLGGEAIPRKLLRDDRFERARSLVVGQAGGALAQIHSMNAASFRDELEEPDQIAQFRGVLDLIGDPRPVFELGFRWLELHPCPERTSGIVHGDFRTGNLLLDDSGLVAVLDWELAHLGNPIEDLGWFCVRSWRFGSPHPAGGFGSVDELLEAYRAAGGQDVDAEELRWWELLGTLKWGVMCLIQAATHLSGAARSVELATIGRRACENEWDALGLLRSMSGEERLNSTPAIVHDLATGGGFHGRPTAAELVEAVREFLEGDIRDGLQGRLSYQGRIAANALRMVERELAAGKASSIAHDEVVAVFGVETDGELAAAIRAGDVDDRLDELAVVLAEAVEARVRVANPAWLDAAPLTPPD